MSEDLEFLRTQIEEKTQTIRAMAMERIAHDAEYENWLKERTQLLRERDLLAKENVDLKNQLADLKHEIEMNRWLK